MKKLFLSFAVVCSLAIVSCGGNKAEQAQDTEETTPVEEVIDATAATVVDSAAPDSVVVDTVVAVEAANVQ